MSQLDVEQLPGHRPLAIILRHAERPPVVNLLRHRDALLTVRGKRDSFLLGQKLTGVCPVRVYHSLVVRCQQTARAISGGLQDQSGSCESVEPLAELADYGSIATGDWREIVEIVKRYSPFFLRKWFDGKVPSDRFMPLRKAAYFTLSILVRQLTEMRTSTINITHDWNIMPMREYFFSLRHEEIGKLDFLDGIAAYITEDKVCVVYHEHNKEIDLSSI